MLAAPHTDRDMMVFPNQVSTGEAILMEDGKEPIFIMTIGTHFFKLTNIVPWARYTIEGFAGRVTSRTFFRERGKWKRGPDRLYYGKTHDSFEYRFPISLLGEFRDYMVLNGIAQNKTIEKVREIPEGLDKFFKMRPGFILREDQEPISEYIRSEPEKRSKMVGLQTGKGKTVIACEALSQIHKRVVLVTKPMYIKKWILDFQNYTDLAPKDLMVVQGTDHLKGLIQLAKDDQLPSKVIIISVNTYRSYINAYENGRYEQEYLEYECAPEDFFPLMETGVILIDEVHQEFFAYYRMLLYTQCKLVVSLSATLENLDQFMERMYHIAFPKQDRCKTGPYDRYIDMYNVDYQFRTPEKIRTQEFGSPTYSHSAFEKSIMRHIPTLNRWLEMIDWIIEVGFVKYYQPGDKLATFAATKEMCTIMRDHIRKRFPQFTTERYIYEDPYENIIEPDIRCTTILSGGTAIDIPGLTCSINTINILSIQANAQTLGRLRKKEGRQVRYYVAFSSQFSKHREYHNQRNDMLRDRVKGIAELPYVIDRV